MTSRARCSLLAPFALVAASAGAQTRAEAIRQQRAEKADRVRPYQLGKLEALLFTIEDRQLLERVLNPPRGFFARVGGLPEAAGFALGPSYRYSNHSLSATTTTVASKRGYFELDTRLAWPRLANGRAFIALGGRRRDFQEVDFFGLGPGTVDAARTTYALRETSFGLSAGASPAEWWSVAGSVEYESPRIGRGRDRRVPSTDERFSEAAAPGLQAQPDFLRLGARATLDYTERPLGPPAGGRYRISYERYSDRDLGRYSFDRWHVDLQQYIPIVSGARTLVLRARAESLTPDAGHEVPFYLQPTLGGSSSLRGLRAHQLRDRHLLLLQAEYRWEVNAFMTGALFYDAGKVAARRRDLSFDDLDHDYGIGVRFGFLANVALRAEVAFGSREGTRLLFKFGDVF